MIQCSLCGKDVASFEGMKLSETLNRVRDHYMTHSWLRRAWHNFLLIPKRRKLRKFQKETEAKWRGKQNPKPEDTTKSIG